MRNNVRLDELSFIFSTIAEISLIEAKELILRTDTGRAVMNGNRSTLYEQHSSNIESIIHELNPLGIPKTMIDKFTPDKIYESMLSLYQYNKQRKRSIPRKFSANHNTVLINNTKINMKNQMHKMLLSKRQEMINSRRINSHVNKIKG